jgi:hypothetical protein
MGTLIDCISFVRLIFLISSHITLIEESYPLVPKDMKPSDKEYSGEVKRDNRVDRTPLDQVDHGLCNLGRASLTLAAVI